VNKKIQSDNHNQFSPIQVKMMLLQHM